jgi:hypothetical protein
MNTCGACGEDFGSLAAFDLHRIGKHEYTYDEGVRMDPPREDGRRCLTGDEMRGSPSFEVNRRGRWSIARDLTRASERDPGRSTGIRELVVG